MIWCLAVVLGVFPLASNIPVVIVLVDDHDICWVDLRLCPILRIPCISIKSRRNYGMVGAASAFPMGGAARNMRSRWCLVLCVCVCALCFALVLFALCALTARCYFLYFLTLIVSVTVSMRGGVFGSAKKRGHCHCFLPDVSSAGAVG